MVEPDWQPLPIYHSLREHIANYRPILPAGRHQAEHWAIQGEREPIRRDEADFGVMQVLHGEMSFRIRGTGLALAPPPSADYAGPIATSPFTQESAVILCQECPETEGTDTLFIPVPSGYALDAVWVYDRGWALQYPVVAIIFILAGLALSSIGAGWQERRAARRK